MTQILEHHNFATTCHRVMQLSEKNVQK